MGHHERTPGPDGEDSRGERRGRRGVWGGGNEASGGVASRQWWPIGRIGRIGRIGIGIEIDPDPELASP
ncbi:MAG: hypothetical protein ACOX52_17290 [Verrucomicrobiota bacterium]